MAGEGCTWWANRALFTLGTVWSLTGARAVPTGTLDPGLSRPPWPPVWRRLWALGTPLCQPWACAEQSTVCHLGPGAARAGRVAAESPLSSGLALLSAEWDAGEGAAPQRGHGLPGVLACPGHGLPGSQPARVTTCQGSRPARVTTCPWSWSCSPRAAAPGLCVCPPRPCPPRAGAAWRAGPVAPRQTATGQAPLDPICGTTASHLSPAAVPTGGTCSSFVSEEPLGRAACAPPGSLTHWTRASGRGLLHPTPQVQGHRSGLSIHTPEAQTLLTREATPGAGEPCGPGPSPELPFACSPSGLCEQ